VIQNLNVPAGMAEMLVVFSPAPDTGDAVSTQSNAKKPLEDYPAFGMWADRDDMQTP
jgi:hypothetical protein